VDEQLLQAQRGNDARVARGGNLTRLLCLSHLLGESVFKERSIHRDAVDVTSSKAPRHRSLAPIDSIPELRRDHGLVVYGHIRPARPRLRPSCRDRRLHHLARVK
jgi:hypothetical protein